jgi:hypothetical protein
MGTVTPRSCRAWRGRLAMRAVDGLDVDEADLVAAHLAGCAPCREEADELEVVAGLLSTVDVSAIDPVEPSPTHGSAERSATERPGAERAAASEGGGRGLPSAGPGSWAERAARRAAVAVGTVAAAVAVTASLLAASAGSVAAPPGRSVTLHGQAGVRASVLLTAEPWGSRAVLSEDGQTAGSPFTVSMESSSGYRWVAGSYRTGSKPLQVQLTCPVAPGQITEVWVTGPSGQTVLSGYA